MATQTTKEAGMIDFKKIAVGDLVGYKGFEYKVLGGAEMNGKKYFEVRTHNTRRIAWIPVAKVESHRAKA